MGLNSWFRAKARATLDGLFCSSSPDVKRFGDEGSGWVIHTRPMPQVCDCAGAAKDMTFELELAKVAEQRVLVFDPSPTGVRTAERTECGWRGCGKMRRRRCRAFTAHFGSYDLRAQLRQAARPPAGSAYVPKYLEAEAMAARRSNKRSSTLPPA